MKKITCFKNIFETTDPIFVDVLEILKRIKEGNSKEIIEKIRAAENDSEYQNLKKRLPSICFSGRFSQRESESLLEHSGLICLDVDKLNLSDLQEIKDLICADDHVYSCFISPGGAGLKIIVQIADQTIHHKGQFLALEDYFNEKLKGFTSTQLNEKTFQGKKKKIDEKQGKFLRVHIDKSGKDVNRVCYESWDPEIYYNEDSELWYEIKEETELIKEVDDFDKVIELLQKWIDSNDSYYKGNRNNFMYKFASALCRFGISEMRASHYLSAKYADFPRNELETTIKSAYKGNNFASQQFSEKEIKTGFAKVNIEEKKAITAFWSINDRGRVKIDSKQFLKFIEANGFGIYRHSQGDKKWQFVKVSNMIVDVVDVLDIKQHILAYVEKHAPEPVFDELQNKNRYFENTYLNALPLIEVEQIRDGKDCSYIFFEDFYYKITATDQTKHSYIDLEGRHIWRNQICKRNITEVVGYKDHDFAQFIVKALGGKKEAIKSAMTALGYGIHTYKKKRLAKLVYACDASDAELDGLAAGGSGKNLFIEALEFVRSVTKVDGKDFDKRDKFKFQTVADDTQIVSIDDYEGDIKELFTKVTGHFEVEKKGLDKSIIEFDRAPKIFVSSNSAPKGFSDSFARRLHEVNFSDHYNANHTPADDFGDRDFFSDDWTQKDYNAFYSFMFKCVQIYLRDGLLEYEAKTDTKFKQMVKNVGREFTEYFLQKDIPEFVWAQNFHAEYVKETGDDVKIGIFYSNLRKMCAIYGWKLITQGAGELKEIKIKKEL